MAEYVVDRHVSEQKVTSVVHSVVVSFCMQRPHWPPLSHEGSGGWAGGDIGGSPGGDGGDGGAGGGDGGGIGGGETVA